MALTLKEAIQLLESRVWISLRFFTADVNKGTGGKVLEIPQCRIAKSYEKNDSGLIIDGPFVSGTGFKKNPYHNFHFTRNVELPNKQLRKVHPILITHINNLPVV